MPGFAFRHLGLLFNPMAVPAAKWMGTHAQCPTPLLLDANTLRIFFACRPTNLADPYPRSIPAYADLDLDDNFSLRSVARRPILELGRPGTFDQFGITPTSIVDFHGKLYLYYTGWARQVGVPYSMAIGLAVSTDNGAHFKKLGEGPILGPTPDEPFLQSGAIVRILNDTWHMWYITGRPWVENNGKLEAVYHFVHAVSADGIKWDRDAQPVIPSTRADECQVSFGLFQTEAHWHVIFAHRSAIGFRDSSGGAYRLGYAHSRDLAQWNRDDGAISDFYRSAQNWDNEMQCYPQVAETKDGPLLLYCGNQFGREGIGGAWIIETEKDGSA